MKKFILTLVFIFCTFTCTSLANGKACIVAVYENGILYSCASGTYDGTSAYADIKLPEGAYTAKAFFTANGTVTIQKGFLNPIPDKGTPKPEAAVSPSATPNIPTAPAATEQPSAKPTKAPRPTYPSAYESEKDAVEAIAVVESVGVTASDDENKNEIRALCRGESASFKVDNDINISSAPTEHAYMAGADVKSLKKGDVIMITCRVSGGVKRVDLIVRPPETNAVTEDSFGSSFEEIFSDGTNVASRSDWGVLHYGRDIPSKGTYYAFGVIRSRRDGTLVLMNSSGIENDALYIDLSDNVIVYTCNVEDKKELSVGGEGDIIRSEIVKNDLDEDDNVISWNEDRSYTYALVRVVDGTAPELVVYKGYGS